MPNADSHFAAGDIVSWSGIKRAGGAMHQGHYSATNIHQLMLQKATGHTPKLLELVEVPPMIGLAVGKKGMSYDPVSGVGSGEETMKIFFGDDLGFKSELT